MRKLDKIGIILMSPWVAGFILFYILPFLGGIYYSLIDGPVTLRFVGIKNYVSLLTNSTYLLSLKNTFIFTLMCTPPLVVGSFLIAGVLHFAYRRMGFIQWFLFIPLVIPSAVVIGLWKMYFAPGGFVNYFLELLQITPPEWFLGKAMRIPIWLLYQWRNLGFGIIIYLSAWDAIPQELYDACSIDGGGRFLYLRKIAFPMLLPASLVLTVLSIINSFKIFKEAYLLGGAYPAPAVYTLQHYINNQFYKLNYQKLTSGAYIFALVVFLLFMILQRFLKKGGGALEYQNEN